MLNSKSWKSKMHYPKIPKRFPNNCSISLLEGVIYPKVEALELFDHVARLMSANNGQEQTSTNF